MATNNDYTGREEINGMLEEGYILVADVGSSNVKAQIIPTNFISKEKLGFQSEPV